MIKLGNAPRRRLRSDLIVMAIRSSQNNPPVDLSVEARRLLEEYSNSGLTLRELEDLIYRAIALNRWAATLNEHHQQE